MKKSLQRTPGKGRTFFRIGIVAVIIIAVIMILRAGPYKVIRIFGHFTHGPEQLYVNRDVQQTADSSYIYTGAKWLDSVGDPIQAHGGQIQRMPVPGDDGELIEKYIWIGENKTSGHYGNDVAVYSSEDLLGWTFEGNVLRSIDSREQLDSDPYFTAVYGALSDLEKDEIYHCINRTTVMERPKMLYCEKTGQYVIWFHSDDATEMNSYSYDVGSAGVAVSDSPFGPFRFIKRMRLSHCPEGQIDCYPTSKGESRDINLFKDDDGTAYVIYSSENNKTLYISKLDETYLNLSADPEAAVYRKDYIRLFPGSMREAPVLAKIGGRYYLMSSSTTGWAANQARVWSAQSIFGDWRNDGNPCIGIGASMTFDTQSTSLFQTPSGQWVYCGDRWNSEDLYDSRYVWLPVNMVDEKIRISWEETWIW